MVRLAGKRGFADMRKVEDFWGQGREDNLLLVRT